MTNIELIALSPLDLCTHALVPLFHQTQLKLQSIQRDCDFHYCLDLGYQPQVAIASLESLTQMQVDQSSTFKLSLRLHTFDATVLSKIHATNLSLEKIIISRPLSQQILQDHQLLNEIQMICQKTHFTLCLEVGKQSEIQALIDQKHQIDAQLFQAKLGVVLCGLEASGACGDQGLYILIQTWHKLIEKSGFSLDFWTRGVASPSLAAAVCLAGGQGMIVDECLIVAQILSWQKEGLIHQQEVDFLFVHLQKIEFQDAVEFDGYRLLTRQNHIGMMLKNEQKLSDDEYITDIQNRIFDSLQTRKISAQIFEKECISISPDFPRSFLVGLRFKDDLSALFQTLYKTMQEILNDLQHHHPFKSKSDFAQSLDLQYPILQGPMTRVSDTAKFAQAVSDAGALPFLAFSLMLPEQVKQLATQTKELLKNQSFGIGILGFAPTELRVGQMEVIKAIKPKAVLIAGGRPSQARELEEIGIQSFLHVPSPGLLKLFIKDGVKRFVFEGSECGGHIGPMTSLTLWSAQMAELLNVASQIKKPLPLADYAVVFAGGICDELSTAMLSCFAIRLSKLGAKVAVLMGSAYLFTQESVTSHAILPKFQEVALLSKETAVVQSGPGHATRCAITPFVEAFENEKQFLISEKKPSKEIWATLENYNVGKLRIASKGKTRVGDQIIEVSESEQYDQGMYMLGEVATIMDQTLSIHELHEKISIGALRYLQTQKSNHTPQEKTQNPQKVAIIGMSCLFPQSNGLDEYLFNLWQGKDCITEVPRERWHQDLYYRQDAQGGKYTNSKWGGFLDPIVFDPSKYGIPPKSLSAIEPVQILSLELAQRAMVDAGLDQKPFDRKRTSVIFGAEAGTDLANAYSFKASLPQWLGEIPEQLEGKLPSLTEDSFAGILANVISGRIANRLDLGGSNYTVDAACASSLAALDVAMKELLYGESDLVICGGADLHNSIQDYLMFSSVHALSPTGKSKPFSALADGISLGEGIAVLVLKRLDQAINDQDRIYAVIDGVASSSDGKALGLTAPRKDGQILAIQRAYQRAHCSTDQISLIEAHGTGTVVGDKTELLALTEVYQDQKARSIALGSVKSQIGHTKCAAGLASIVKVALSLYHKTLPATLHTEKTNPAYDPHQSPFVFYQKPQPWLANEYKAAISAFGFGGTNFHTVLSRSPQKEISKAVKKWEYELFCFRGRDFSEALKTTAHCIQSLQTRKTLGLKANPLTLRELSFAYHQHQRELPVQITILAKDFEHLLQQAIEIQSIADITIFKASDFKVLNQKGIYIKHQYQLFSSKPTVDQIAFLFPGQGAQKIMMQSDLFAHFPQTQIYLEEAQRLGVASVVYPTPAVDEVEQKNQNDLLSKTTYAQSALGMADLSIWKIFDTLALKGKHLAGHSYGELVALCVAGVIDERDLLEISFQRGLSILEGAAYFAQSQNESELDTGVMAAVIANEEKTAAAILGIENVVIANLNAPEQTVISGTKKGIEQALVALKEKGLKAKKIQVSCAFHSPVISQGSQQFSKILTQKNLGKINEAYMVWSNQTALPYTPEEVDHLPQKLGDHISHQVRFVDEIQGMYREGARIFIELGPGKILNTMVGQILKDKDDVICINPSQGEEKTLYHLLSATAQMLLLGIELNTAKLWEDRECKEITISEITLPHPSPLLWYVNGQRAWTDQGLPSFAYQPIEPPSPPYRLTQENIPKAIEIQPESPDLIDTFYGNDSMISQDSIIAQDSIIQQSSYFVQTTYTQTQEETHDMQQDPKQIVLLSYLENMKQLQMSQHQVLLAYLQQPIPSSVPTLRQPAPPPAPLRPTQTTVMPSMPALTTTTNHLLPQDSFAALTMPPTWASQPSQPSQPSQTPETKISVMPTIEVKVQKSQGHQNISQLLIQIVSDRTGYPTSMLGLDMDLEAELSVDSIKRIEILGNLGESLALDQEDQSQRDELVEKMAQMKTLRQMIDYLEQRDHKKKLKN